MKRIIALLVISALFCGCAKTPETTTVTTTTETAPATPVQPFGEALEPMFTRDTEIKKDTPDFTPIAKTRDVKYGNLPCNLNTIYMSGFICPDTENDILYFTDVGNTNHICKKENGKITGLVSQSGSYLNLWDGWLYYICDSDNPVGYSGYVSLGSGDIWRYNLETGETQLFYEGDIYTLTVSDYGIDFHSGYVEKTTDENGLEVTTYKLDLYRIDFNGENLCKLMNGGENAVCYGENILVNHNGYKSFYNTESNTYTDILPRNTYSHTINGDWLTYLDRTFTEITALNLTTGETRNFKNGSVPLIYGYVWVGDTLYASMDYGIIEITDEGAKAVRIAIEDGQSIVTAESIMTDGKHLYGLTTNFRLYRYDYDEMIGMYRAVEMGESDSVVKDNLWLFEKNENASATDNSVNLKNSYYEGKVCYISETDTLFHSDNTGLYMSSEDTTVRLTEMEAMSINVLNGRVYFINSAVRKTGGHPSGKAYYIDLKTGECKTFIDEEITRLAVSGNDIIYVKSEKVMYEGREVTANYTFRCDIDGKGHDKTAYKNLISDENFCAGSDTQKGVRVYSLETDEEVLFAEDKDNMSLISLYKNQLLFFGKGDKKFGELKRINLSDNSVTEYSFPNDYVKDYAFFGGKICYLDHSGNFVVADENVSESYYYPNASGTNIDALYSGREHIYGLRSDGKIVRLSFEKDAVQNRVTEEILSYEEN